MNLRQENSPQLLQIFLIHVVLVCFCQFFNRGFARQPCCMAGTKDSFSHGKRSSFICKTFSLFLPCNTAAMQNLYCFKLSLVIALSSNAYCLNCL